MFNASDWFRNQFANSDALQRRDASVERIASAAASVGPLNGRPTTKMFAPRDDNKAKHPGKAILSGGISGGIEICCTYPTEFVKTQLQLYGKSGKFSGPLDVIKTTYSERGVLGFYRGLMTLLYTSVPKSAVRFGSYEYIKSFAEDEKGKLTRPRTLLCGLGAGVTEAIVVVCPAETIKVKFIHDQNSANPKYKGFFNGTATIVRTEGIGGIYKGLTATILKQGSNQAIRFFVYGEITKWICGDVARQLSPVESFFAGATAGAASVFGNTPIDVLKTKMQGLEASQYRNTWHCAQETYRRDGLTGFYKGVTPRLGRVCLDVAIVMTLYSQIVQALDKVWVTEDK